METNPRATFALRSRAAGAALVMTLITLSVLVILLIGFLSTMLTERQAATGFEQAERTKLIAAGAVSHAIDILRTNIPEPARLSEGPRNAPGENWLVNPGRLTVIREGQSPVFIPLHTGEVTEAPPPNLPRDAYSVDLNQPLPGETTPAITGLPENASAPRPAMRVKWVNLLRDPSKPADSQNKLVGRYAFWMDDENARLNINTALGKPTPGTDGQFDAQVQAKYLTPVYTNRSNSKVNAAPQGWALGRPGSVNLDVLFQNSNQLLYTQLQDHVFTLGYSRYPEAILDFITLKGVAARDWYDKSRYNLTAYNRSPEFNAFGRSRLFTSYIPFSLESGPSYQLPFIHDPTGAYLGDTNTQILHLNTLLGSFGFTTPVNDDDGLTVTGGNRVNEAQMEMLMDYLRRRWPGYDRSFVDKYGEAECRQIALNAALMARMSTTLIAPGAPGDVTKFTPAYAARTTSVNYSPKIGQTFANGVTMDTHLPGKMYWRFPGVGKNGLFLPQTPGPHITEVRLHVQATSQLAKPDGSSVPKANARYIQYWYEVEYYMHPFGPVVDLEYFPTRMDYFEIEVPGAGKQQFGPSDTSTEQQLRPDANWSTWYNLDRLAIRPDLASHPSGTVIGPSGSIGPSNFVYPNRLAYASEVLTMGETTDTPPSDSSWTPKVFDISAANTVTVNIRMRPGMSIKAGDKTKDSAHYPAPTKPNQTRPRQMIPLGETRDDTLQASFVVSLQEEKRDHVISWQISDPRLSSDLSQWVDLQGAGAADATGTLGKQNANEPGEDSPEKSKYRYLQRALNTVKIAGYFYDRPDEFDPTSRITSPGYWSLLHTGMQSGRPWRTLDFGPEAAPSNTLVGNDVSPPDWLLLDLFGATFPMSQNQWLGGQAAQSQVLQRLPDQFSSASYMNSTSGQVNLNSRIYPRTKFFNPPDRTKPLQAVFQNLPGLDAKQIASDINSYQSDTRYFDYVGKVANVSSISGSGSTPWQREFALRNMAGVLTTKSNTFGVWGVAQVVKKQPANQQFDSFEKGDQVVSEKRFYALVERYVWPGRDGIPGNGHINKINGNWDRIATQVATITSTPPTNTVFQLPGSPPLVKSGSVQIGSTSIQRLDIDLSAQGQYPRFDGPERVAMDTVTSGAMGRVAWDESTLENAYNPPQAVTKYRVVSFKYLDQ